MRIAFLVESLQMAGAERVVQELAQAGRDEGCEARVITLQETQACEASQYQDVQEFPLFKRGEFHWPKSALIAALRLSAATAHCPIVVSSVLERQEYPKDLQGTLPKPYTRRQVEALLKRVLPAE